MCLNQRFEINVIKLFKLKKLSELCHWISSYLYIIYSYVYIYVSICLVDLHALNAQLTLRNVGPTIGRAIAPLQRGLRTFSFGATYKKKQQ